MYALLDWDQTLRNGATVFEWFYFLCQKGLIDEREVAVRNQMIDRYNRKEMDHDELADQINAHYASCIKGMKLETYERLREEFLKQDIGPHIPTTEVVVNWLKKMKADIVVVSGSPLRLIQPHFCWMGVTQACALEENVVNGVFDGQRVGDGGSKKKRIVERCFQHYGERPLIAMGDSMSDIPMLKAACLPIVVGENPDMLHIEGAVHITQDRAGAEKLEKSLEDLRVRFAL